MIQLQVLNKILETKDTSIITKNNLDSTFFSNYKQEFNFIKDHINNYGVVPDTQTFLYKFSNFDLVKVEEPISYLLDELYKDRNLNNLVFTFNKIKDYINEGKVNEALQLFKTSNDKMASSRHIQATNILKDISRYQDYLDRGLDFDRYFVKTGFKELDKLIGGWDREEELATIVARTNVGKSFISMKFAEAAAEQGLKVGYYSGEMSAKKVGYRIDTLISHIPNGALIHGNEDVKLDYKKYIDDLPNLVKGEIEVLTPKELGRFATVSDLRAFIELYNLDILFIDQRSLMDDERKGRTRTEIAGNISMDLKRLQELVRIPIITVSQQNRTENEDGTFDTTQVAESDRISQDSTTIIFIEKRDDIMKLHLVKSRDNVNNKVLTYNADFSTGVFRFIPEEGTLELSDGEVDYETRYDIDTQGVDIF